MKKKEYYDIMVETSLWERITWKYSFKTWSPTTVLWSYFYFYLILILILFILNLFQSHCCNSNRSILQQQQWEQEETTKIATTTITITTTTTTTTTTITITTASATTTTDSGTYSPRLSNSTIILALITFLKMLILSGKHHFLYPGWIARFRYIFTRA